MTGYQKASVEDVLNQLMEENRKLIKRVETLEENLVKLSNDNKDLKSEINDLKEQIADEDNTYGLWEQDDFDDSDEVELPAGYKCKGWIFYSNKDDCNCLYKIKEDGTCNTKLTDYSVDSYYPLWSYDSGYIIVSLERPRNGRYEEKFPV